LSRFFSSGSSAAEFCRREGVSEPSFYYWKRRLAADVAPSLAHSFTPVRIVEEKRNPDCFDVEVVLPSGVRFFVPDSTSAARVRQLALALLDLDRGAASC
jgi:hypothetical protein